MGERVYVNGTPIGGVYLEKLDVERVCDRLFYSESVSSPMMVREENGYYGVKPERLDEQWEKYRAVLKKLTIMSDAFMRNVLKKKECTEYILRVIMGNPELEVLDQVLQKDYKNLQGRSAILDCVARDAKGILYNIEIQQESEGASPKRARYHSGLMDMNLLKKGQSFENLPESYVIFITREDVLGKQRAVYRIKRVVEEDNEDFGDGAYIVYVNASYQDLSEVGRLIHDLHCTDAAEMYSEVLAERVWELKETERGVENMCHELEMLYQDGVEEGIKLGERKGEQSGIVKGERQAILRSILHIVQKTKISPDEAMDMLGIEAEEREEYRKRIS
ncbi:PD-(D/E)XK nuclease family transposase [uncultured Clostridium sp.]|uniref:PD-(D/E)XK nuclease family transposase n=1 Tax=uncultured Clostridium sp. TaxID=59620 RepID=UPI0025EAA62D|nr:PD-(D/E)XK nuclease family transposase [uncultured Clostridium sp.]